MMYLILILILVVLLVLQPYLDIYTDYKNETHIIVWYNSFTGKRKFLKIFKYKRQS